MCGLVRSACWCVRDLIRSRAHLATENQFLRQQLAVLRRQVHLRKTLAEFTGSYYHSARPHQGLDQQIPAEVHNPVEHPKVGPIKTREVMNGLYHVYYRDAAAAAA